MAGPPLSTHVKEIIALAKSIAAQEYQSETVNHAHIIIACVRDIEQKDPGRSDKVGFNINEMITTMTEFEMLKTGTRQFHPDELIFASSGLKVLELARETARQNRASAVEAEHLILGCIKVLADETIEYLKNKFRF